MKKLEQVSKYAKMRHFGTRMEKPEQVSHIGEIGHNKAFRSKNEES